MIEASQAPDKRLPSNASNASGGGGGVHCGRQLNQKRQVKLKTCADVYEHWRSYKRLYKKAPRDGVEFQIDYIDTGLAMGEEERARAPIALALHGAPGSYHDYSLLISHLAGQQVRVIAPNFPEYIATVKTKVLFRHSADEKAAYLRDFLKAIGVKTIDLLISHSSAIFPTLLILLNANEQALERRKQAAREQAAAEASRRGAPRNNGAAVKVQLSAFSELGDQLKGGAEDALAGPGGSSNASETCADDQAEVEVEVGVEVGRAACGRDEGAVEEEEEEEEFSDACDQLDSNNNEQEVVKPAGKREADAEDEGPVIELRQLSVEGKPAVEVAGVQTAATRGGRGERAPRARQGLKRRGQDVIVQFEEPIEIKAVALFNPAGHRLPKSMKPTWFKCGSVHVYQHKFGRSLFRKFGPAFLTVVGVPVRVDNMDNVMLSATVMRNSKCQRVVKQLEQLSQMKIPTLLVFSENDKLIEREIFYEMTQFMRLDPKKFDVFNNDGDIELSQSIMNDWIRVMVFKAGGHYAYSNYAKTVNRAVSELLARVRPNMASILTQAAAPAAAAAAAAATAS